MRIGINVPDDLIASLKPFRNAINISQVCRGALQARIKAYERASALANDEEGMQVAVERLRQEYREQEIDWEALGHEDAKLWVQLASLQDFEDLFHRLEVLQRQEQAPSSRIALHLPGVKTFADRQNENKEWFCRQYALDDNTNHNQQAESAYDLGWLSYVLAVWQMVKDGIAEDTKAREEALRETSADKELSDHLMSAE